MVIIAKISEFVQPWVNSARKHEVELILALAMALLSLLSFAIGYIVAKEQLKEPLRIERSEIQSTKSETNSND